MRNTTTSASALGDDSTAMPVGEPSLHTAPVTGTHVHVSGGVGGAWSEPPHAATAAARARAARRGRVGRIRRGWRAPRAASTFGRGSPESRALQGEDELAERLVLLHPLVRLAHPRRRDDGVHDRLHLAGGDEREDVLREG